MGIERSKANCLAASSAAEVWSAANMGMNFIVHVGRFYDRCGARITAYAAAALKAVGLFGMALMQALRLIFFFLKNESSDMHEIIILPRPNVDD